MKRLFILFLIPMAFACQKSVDNSVNDANEFELSKSEIVFQNNSVATKASEVTTELLNSFNVVATSGTSSQTAVWDPASCLFSKDGSVFKGGKYWPNETVSWNFYASNAAISFAASGSTVSISDCNTDIVCDYIQGASFKASNAFSFDHILCQIGTVTMKAPEGFTVKDMKVSLYPITSGTYAMKNDSWSRGNAASSATYILGSANAGVAINTEGGSVTSDDNDLWLVPGQYQLTATYTISKGDFENSYTKHSTVTLQQGKNNNLGLPGPNHDQPNIPGPGDDIQEIIFSISVTPWEDAEVPANFE